MLKTFQIGGIHPKENKITANKPIKEAKLPTKVAIMLSQHIGAPAKPIVNRGDFVKVGTKIAEANGFISSSIHSSVSGKISKIDNVIDSSGYPKPAIFIDVEGDEWEESIDRSDDIIESFSLTSEEIIRKISDYGIVGLGGACFPTNVKLAPPPSMKAECVIINAVECEPYLTSDHQLMIEKAKEIFIGISIMMKASKVDKAYIGIENNKKDVIQLFTNISKEKYNNVEVVALKIKYPQGGEKQLIDAILKKKVNSGALPISTGAIVQNVGTAYAVYEAVQKNKPLFERVVTITGKSLSDSSNLLVRVGTNINELIQECGGMPSSVRKIVSGGPMMGKALSTSDIHTVKGMSGVLLIDKDEAERGEIKDCIRCSKCVGVCPMGLEPYLLGVLSENMLFEKMEKERIMDCIECGSCQFICPANRPLLDYCRLGKNKVSNIIRERQSKR